MLWIIFSCILFWINVLCDVGGFEECVFDKGKDVELFYCLRDLGYRLFYCL